jgi:hypothetical protein
VKKDSRPGGYATWKREGKKRKEKREGKSAGVADGDKKWIGSGEDGGERSTERKQ